MTERVWRRRKQRRATSHYAAPNLIGYDALRVYGSPTYHAIKLFATHLGDEILKASATDTDVLVSGATAAHGRCM